MRLKQIGQPLPMGETLFDAVPDFLSVADRVIDYNQKY